MKGEVSEKQLNECLQMGFSEQLIKMAWSQCEYDSQLLEVIINLNEQNNKLQEDSSKKGQVTGDDDVIMNQVILDSLKEAKNTTASFETMNPEQRKRTDGIPVGLKNVGNTCYFNSLLQAYFFNNDFVKSILSYVPPPISDKKDDSDNRLKNSIKLVLNLQSLFISMIASDKKYIDPTEVVKSICDDFGNLLPIGDQKDVGEFNHYFLSRVEEGLQTSKNFNRMDEEPQKEIQIQEEHPHQQEQVEDNSALLRQKSKIFNSESLVSKLFFGRARQIIEFQDDSKTVLRETEEPFNFIPLDIKYKELYDAWDHWIVSDIEGFRNDSGEQVKATKYNWILTPPQSLFFQIERTQYDKEKKDIVKINDPFKFEKEIYIDRFLSQNSKTYLEIRAKVNQIKLLQQQQEAGMKSIQSFNGSLDLLSGVGQIAQFIQMQQQKLQDTPTSFGSLQFSEQDLNKTVQVLNAYNQSINDRYNEYKNRYEQLEQQIQSSYNNLRQHKYQLQSILIHDGFANSGHYYAYIYDAGLKKWVKFNDIHSVEEQEDVVMKEALGGHSNINAYLLVYVRQDISDKDTQYMHPLRSYRLVNDNEDHDMYHSYLSYVQKEQLKHENQLYRQEIEDYKSFRCIEGVVDQYSRKFEFINEQSRLFKNKYEKVNFKPPTFLNAALFVKNHPDNNNNKYENIIKWMILDSAVRDLHPNKINIIFVEQDGFIEKLRNKIKSALSDFKAPKFPLIAQDKQILTKLIQQYNENVTLAAKSVYFMECFLEGKWTQALISLNDICHQIESLNLDSNNYYYRLIQNKQRLLPISIFLDLEQQGKNFQEQEIIQLLGVLINFLNQKSTIFKDLPLWKVQLSILLSDVTQVFEGSPAIKQATQQFQISFDNDVILQEYEQILLNEPHDYTQSVNLFVSEFEPYIWNTHKVDDILFDRLMTQFDQIKAQYKNSIALLDQIKKSSFPIMANERLKQ